MLKRKRSLFGILLLAAVLWAGFSGVSYAAAEGGAREFFGRDPVRLVLLILGVSGLVIEIMSNARGIAGSVSLVSFILFFYGGQSVGNDILIPILLFIIGFILLLIEVFVPGFGLPGIGGIIFMGIGLVVSFRDYKKAVLFLAVSFVISFTIGLILFKKGLRSDRFEKLVLDKDNRETTPRYDQYLGKEGTALTPLRPSGTVLIDETRLDALTEGEFIQKGEKIVVKNVDGFKIFVRRK